MTPTNRYKSSYSHPKRSKGLPPNSLRWQLNSSAMGTPFLGHLPIPTGQSYEEPVCAHGKTAASVPTASHRHAPPQLHPQDRSPRAMHRGLQSLPALFFLSCSKPPSFSQKALSSRVVFSPRCFHLRGAQSKGRRKPHKVQSEGRETLEGHDGKPSQREVSLFKKHGQIGKNT